VVTTSPQKLIGTPFAFIKLRAVETIVWLRRSMTTFCYEEYGAMSCRPIPYSA
jgi:hypothetical protein